MNATKRKEMKLKFMANLGKSNGVIHDACTLTGVGTTSIHNWRKEDKEFDEAIKEAVEYQTIYVESKLFEQIEKGNMMAIIYYLNHKGASLGYGFKIKKMLEEDPKEKTAPQTITFEIAS